MDTIENNLNTDKHKIILDATEKIETVMGFAPQFQSYQQPIKNVDIAPGETWGFLILWFLVLFVQFAMFWTVKQKGK